MMENCIGQKVKTSIEVLKKLSNNKFIAIIEILNPNSSIDDGESIAVENQIDEDDVPTKCSTSSSKRKTRIISDDVDDDDDESFQPVSSKRKRTTAIEEESDENNENNHSPTLSLRKSTRLESKRKSTEKAKKKLFTRLRHRTGSVSASKTDTESSDTEDEQSHHNKAVEDAVESSQENEVSASLETMDYSVDNLSDGVNEFEPSADSLPRVDQRIGEDIDNTHSKFAEGKSNDSVDCCVLSSGSDSETDEDQNFQPLLKAQIQELFKDDLYKDFLLYVEMVLLEVNSTGFWKQEMETLENYEDVIKPAIQRIDKRVASKLELCTSQAWLKPYKEALQGRPQYERRSKRRNQDAGYYLVDCQACGRKDHPWKYEMIFSGPCFDKETFQIKQDPEDDAVTFKVGKFCEEKTKRYHNLYYWRYFLFKDCRNKFNTLMSDSNSIDSQLPTVLQTCLDDDEFMARQFKRLKKCLRNAEDYCEDTAEYRQRKRLFESFTH